MLEDEEEVLKPDLRPPLVNTSAPQDKEPSTDDLDFFRKWQEARQQRRLKGEYESHVIRLTELVNSNLALPIRIREVRVLGADRTRSSFLEYIINPILADELSSTGEGSNTDTLEAALHKTRRISQVLLRSDIFTSITPTLERNRDALAEGQDVDIVVRCRERGRFFLKTATEIGNNEGTASMIGRLRNVFGGGENFEASLSLGSRTRHAFSAALTAPLGTDLRTIGTLSVFATERDLSTFSSCKEVLKGVKAAIRAPSLFGSHEFAYEAALRHIGDLKPEASISIREATGFTTKSALSHTFVRDTRDSAAVPSRGMYLKIFQELAGLGGDATFLKNEVDSQVARYIGHGYSLSISARGGLLYPLNPDRKTLFNDRFQLGGPFSLRSFKHNSMGPRDGDDSLGGEVYWAAGASIIGDLPLKPHWPVKTHIFVNAGRLDTLDRSAPLVDAVRSSLSRPSISAGIGLLYRFDPIRVEVNFAVPLVAAKSDGLQRGLQAGIGIDFL
ncbi:hypothetical protein M422DRAFT_36524 [Sphaerobolus stellatus SS14]|uniref:Bacterial surface antigen (D15) domain-containing protein n=1 Tax=Sphaerobolus stellatus (strain SS14) TaxID=990650 RepID=A0A0C9UZH3_SPHS4|nr:hypothetical protein M422DRAFT_36524 [Sphaerobolus stellatus SS14]